MNKNLSVCKYLAIVALITNAIAFIIIIYLSNHAEELADNPLKEKLNFSMVVSMILCWLCYYLSSRCFVKGKKQNKILEGIGLFGPMGLFIAMMLKDLTPIMGKVRVVDNSSLKGIRKILYSIFGINRYKYLDPGELLPKEVIENMNAESIQVKTVDGKVVNLWTLKNDKPIENKDNNLTDQV